jgi:hypothetical protein
MEATQQPDAEDGALNCLQDKRAFPASDLVRTKDRQASHSDRKAGLTHCKRARHLDWIY